MDFCPSAAWGTIESFPSMQVAGPDSFISAYGPGPKQYLTRDRFPRSIRRDAPPTTDINVRIHGTFRKFTTGHSFRRGLMHLAMLLGIPLNAMLYVGWVDIRRAASYAGGMVFQCPMQSHLNNTQYHNFFDSALARDDALPFDPSQRAI